jgi:predicted ATPase
VAARDRGGANWRHVFCLGILAELYADAGYAAEGRQVLASITAEERAAFCAPEVVRIEGDLLLRRPDPAAGEAEGCFRAAIELAGRRAEKSLELRAATSLARLWQQQGKREDARRLLAGAYNWFTEGFDTADLRAAKQTLQELG